MVTCVRNTRCRYVLPNTLCSFNSLARSSTVCVSFPLHIPRPHLAWWCPLRTNDGDRRVAPAWARSSAKAQGLRSTAIIATATTKRYSFLYLYLFVSRFSHCFIVLSLFYCYRVLRRVCPPPLFGFLWAIDKSGCTLPLFSHERGW